MVICNRKIDYLEVNLRLEIKHNSFFCLFFHLLSLDGFPVKDKTHCYFF